MNKFKISSIFPTTYLLILLLLPIVFYSPTAVTAAEVNAKESIISLLQMQNDAWNNGDLEKFMTGYLNSPELSFTSDGKEVWGYEALKERYQKRYGDNRDSMGKLSFSNIKVTTLGKTNALAVGHWHLVRENSSEKLDGTFSIVLVRTEKWGWKILHDHTSIRKAG